MDLFCPSKKTRETKLSVYDWFGATPDQHQVKIEFGRHDFMIVRTLFESIIRGELRICSIIMSTPSKAGRKSDVQ